MTNHEKHPPQRILIVRLSAIGDVLHTLPALEALRKAHPNAEIGWVVEPPAHHFLQGHPALTRVHLFERKKWRKDGRRNWAEKSRDFFNEVRSHQYDVTIDFQGNAKSGAVGRSSGATRRVGFAGAESRELNRFFQTERHSSPPEALHVVDKNIALANALGADICDPGAAPPPRLPDLPDLKEEIDDAFFDGARRPIIALNPGAGWEAKRWPPEAFGRLAVMLRVAHPKALITVTLGPNEEDLLEGVRRGIKEADADPDEILTPLPILKLLHLASFIRMCGLFVSGDTGPVHLAAALGVPIVALFAEVAVERNGPYGDKVRVIDRCHEKHKRWFWQNRHSVPKEGYPIARVSPEEVLEECHSLLNPTA